MRVKKNCLWKWLVAAGFVAVSSSAFAADPAALAKRLHDAANSSSIDDPALKPWHLKITFQLLDKKGATAEEGTIEEWWSPENDKLIYTSPSYNATRLRRGGEIYWTEGQPSAPYLLERLRDEVVHPLAEDEMKDAVPDLRVESFGKVKLDCIMMDHPIKHVAYPPLGLFPTYCLDQDKDRLRDTFRYGSKNVARNSIGTFQGRGVPVDVLISTDARAVAKGHIATLAGSIEEEHFFDPDSTLKPVSGGATKVAGGVIAGKKLSGDVPVFPVEDKQSRTAGAVHLHAVIGTDGRIHQLTVLDAPSATEAISALVAVRTWKYQPYLLNGVPCSVDTTITVNYNFGPG
ncbi:energy transducer TonB [Granulicella aggregans]|uniref:energy transducer TonB n=1 Tax=Granulicella aggregans TaxID=474949 RepID=UPI0021DF9CC1|nr:energy transducer TonB [Granulicella aggregans]